MDHSIYLKDPGIYKKGNGFYYHRGNKSVTNDNILLKLNAFSVPPAWKSVWYSSNPKCHIQVHGVD